MPATKDAMTRYQILDELLSNQYHDYSLDDLTKAVNERLGEINGKGVSRRCIEKDIHYLEYESPFMVELERYTIDCPGTRSDRTVKKRCVRYKDPSFSIFKKELNHNERYALKELIRVLGQFDGRPSINDFDVLRNSLFASEDGRQIVSFSKNPLENPVLFGQLFTAISNKQVVRLHYYKFGSREENLQCVGHPYLLTEYNQRWYLIVAADSDGKILSFALDRIKMVQPLPAYEYKEYEGDLMERFEDIVGVTLYEDMPVEHIVFWVSDTSKDYVRTKPIHESQIQYKGEREEKLRKEYAKFIGGAFFSIDCIKNYELVRELSSFGENLIVLSPQAIATEIYLNAMSMKEAYENNQVF